MSKNRNKNDRYAHRVTPPVEKPPRVLWRTYPYTANSFAVQLFFFSVLGVPITPKLQEVQQQDQQVVADSQISSNCKVVLNCGIYEWTNKNIRTGACYNTNDTHSPSRWAVLASKAIAAGVSNRPVKPSTLHTCKRWSITDTAGALPFTHFCFCYSRLLIQIGHLPKETVGVPAEKESDSNSDIHLKLLRGYPQKPEKDDMAIQVAAHLI